MSQDIVSLIIDGKKNKQTKPPNKTEKAPNTPNRCIKKNPLLSPGFVLLYLFNRIQDLYYKIEYYELNYSFILLEKSLIKDT